jgi:hypothetical protein
MGAAPPGVDLRAAVDTLAGAAVAARGLRRTESGRSALADASCCRCLARCRAACARWMQTDTAASSPKAAGAESAGRLSSLPLR